jgi:hypothetical protein
VACWPTTSGQYPGVGGSQFPEAMPRPVATALAGLATAAPTVPTPVSAVTTARNVAIGVSTRMVPPEPAISAH